VCSKAIRERLAEQERVKEEKLIVQFLAKCAEDDRKDAIAKKARAEATARFQAEIAVQRELKAGLYEQQKLEELKALEEAKRREDFKRRVIEEARRKLLMEHASKLRGFLPRGVITSNADLELLKAFDRNKDGQLEPEEMDLARAAFAAFDAGADKGGRGAAPGGGGGGGGGAGARAQAPPAQQQQQAQQAHGARQAGGAAAPAPRPADRGKSSVSFGGDAFDDPTARQRK